MIIASKQNQHPSTQTEKADYLITEHVFEMEVQNFARLTNEPNQDLAANYFYPTTFSIASSNTLHAGALKCCTMPFKKGSGR
jgi:hypothetical protein